MLGRRGGTTFVRLRARSKYHARPIVLHGFRFASQREGARYLALREIGDAGALTNLELQPAFPLVVNSMTIGRYLADFAYTELPSGRRVVEDVKGVRTPIYRLKAKLVRALYGVVIAEV